MKISAYVLPGIPHAEMEKTMASMKDRILRMVSETFDISVEKMKDRTRKMEVVQARHVAMFLMRRRTRLLLREIADIFGGRDHTTVMHAIQTVKDHMDTESFFKETVEFLLENI